MSDSKEKKQKFTHATEPIPHINANGFYFIGGGKSKYGAKITNNLKALNRDAINSDDRMELSTVNAVVKNAKGKDVNRTEYGIKFPHGNIYTSSKRFSDVHPIVMKNIYFHMNMSYGSSYANTATYFDRLYSVYPSKELDSVCQYVFIVRPDLYIFNRNMKVRNGTALMSYTQKQLNTGYRPNSSPSRDEFIKMMYRQNPLMVKSLTRELSASHDFIPFLVGRTESLQVPDYSIKTYQLNQPYTNYNLPYASHALESMTGGQFEVTFREDNNYHVHKLFQTWLYYINAVTRNMFGPHMDHIRHNIIDYATSVYCITCRPDAKTIIYWTKYTGAIPTSVPNSDTGFNLRGTVNNKVTIPFSYFHQESLNPYIIYDFNQNSHITKDTKLPIKSEGKLNDYAHAMLGEIGIADSYENDSQYNLNDSRQSWLQSSFDVGAPVSLDMGNGLSGRPYITKNKSTQLYELHWFPAYQTAKKKNEIIGL